MNEEIKDRWIAALKSGEYKQGQNVLRANDEFCCLGVLCDLAVKEGVAAEIPALPDGGGVYTYGDPRENYEFTRQTGVLPFPVLDWAGVIAANPVVRVDNRQFTLSELNDSGRTFEEIAEFIKDNL